MIDIDKIIIVITKHFISLFKNPLGIDSEYGFGVLDSLKIIASISFDNRLTKQAKLTEQDFSDNHCPKQKILNDLNKIITIAKN